MALLPLLLRGGRVLRTGLTRPERLDLLIGEDGRTTRIGLIEPLPPGTKVIELSGQLISPGLVDVHQHLDKALTSRAVSNPSGTLVGAVTAFNAYASKISREDLTARAERTLDACIARGTVALRTHANVDPVLQLKSVETLVSLRDRYKDKVKLQVVAFVTAGATKAGAPAKQWLDDAIRAGADVVGGTPAIADDPASFLDMLFDTAVQHDCPIDLHLDEHLDAGRQLFDAVIERTRSRKMQGRVAVGHCSALSAMPADAARRIVQGFVEAGIAVITLPSANLYLQGREAAMLPPRGLTRVRDLIDAGVRVAAGTDNIQDPFVPVGTGDMLEIARWTLLAGHLGASDLGKALNMVTQAPAEIMGLQREYGVHEGARSDLIVTDAEDADDLVASGPPVRGVFFGGRLVAGAL